MNSSPCSDVVLAQYGEHFFLIRKRHTFMIVALKVKPVNTCHFQCVGSVIDASRGKGRQ